MRDAIEAARDSGLNLALVNRPQNSLTGTIYGGETASGRVPWVVAAAAPRELLAGMGLTVGPYALTTLPKASLTRWQTRG
jgi:hypothetical protein